MIFNKDNTDDKETLKEQVIAALKLVFDPEIPVNIYDLGLVYNIDINDNNDVKIQMTLTAPACPFAQTFPGMVEAEVRTVEGINDIDIELVWDPQWTQERMSEEARVQLGWY